MKKKAKMSRRKGAARARVNDEGKVSVGAHLVFEESIDGKTWRQLDPQQVPSIYVVHQMAYVYSKYVRIRYNLSVVS